MSRENDMEYVCDKCSQPVNKYRYEIGYTTCKPCGEEAARQRKFCVVPMAKSNYIVVTDRELLKQLNKYART
jgi:ribosomal protein L37AE/L43A